MKTGIYCLYTTYIVVIPLGQRSGSGVAGVGGGGVRCAQTVSGRPQTADFADRRTELKLAKLAKLALEIGESTSLWFTKYEDVFVRGTAVVYP